jgi:hypothetical protein
MNFHWMAEHLNHSFHGVTLFLIRVPTEPQ